MQPILEAKNLLKNFPLNRGILERKKAQVHAVRSVSLKVNKGETLGIVGESGCGKSTLARMLVGLTEPTNGDILIQNNKLDKKSQKSSLPRVIQYVFQDPLSSLNPRKTIRQVMNVPLTHLQKLSEKDREKQIKKLFKAVNLQEEFLERYPHEFSGGQAQRIGIARALAASPRILVLDEPVSALDVSVQAQVLNLLSSLKKDFGLTYVFISHDLAVVETVSDRVAVMYFGEIVEIGPAQEIFTKPKHPYTKLLAESAPKIGTKLQLNEKSNTDLPDPTHPPKGCAFFARCNHSTDKCLDAHPELQSDENSVFVACHNPLG